MQLAASGRPKTEKELIWLIKVQHIQSIITLTEDSLKKSIRNFSTIIANLKFSYYHIPANDGQGFYPYQFDKITKLFHENVIKSQPLLIHCDGGYGRTSTALLAIWIHNYQLSLDEASKQLKEIRDQLIFTDIQAKSLIEWKKKR